MERELLAYLKAQTAITALVGTRMNWGLRGQGAQLPAITLNLIDKIPQYSDEGEVGLFSSRVQIDGWAENDQNAAALGEAVRAALSGKRFPADSLLLDAWSQGETRETEQGSGTTAPIHRSRTDYLIWHKEP